jgi:hypothetical protein
MCKKRKIQRCQKKPRIPALPLQKLCEKLGLERIDNFVQDLQVPQESRTLVDRLRDLGFVNIQASQSGTPKNEQVESSREVESSTSKTVILNQILVMGGRTLTGKSGSIMILQATPDSKRRRSEKNTGNTFNLNDFAAGKRIFSPISSLLPEFAAHRKRYNWSIVFISTSDHFLAYYLTQKKGCASVQFGVKRVLNPNMNLILLEQGKTTKRIASQNRQLLHPGKGGFEIDIYNPDICRNLILQQKLEAVYETYEQRGMS